MSESFEEDESERSTPAKSAIKFIFDSTDMVPGGAGGAAGVMRGNMRELRFAGFSQIERRWR
jgi:oxalate decarboxylase/phosphoglucose isomerase-like protein (cupin superfamily)